jgi:hypothetical protein
MQCCGSGMFIPDPGSDFFQSRIPDPNCLHPGSRIRTVSIPDPGSSSNNLSILTPKKPKKWFLSSKKYNLGCSSRIPDPDAYFLPIPDPGSRGHKGTQSRIPDPDPQLCFYTAIQLEFRYYLKYTVHFSRYFPSKRKAVFRIRLRIGPVSNFQKNKNWDEREEIVLKLFFPEVSRHF